MKPSEEVAPRSPGVASHTPHEPDADQLTVYDVPRRDWRECYSVLCVTCERSFVGGLQECLELVDREMHYTPAGDACEGRLTLVRRVSVDPRKPVLMEHAKGFEVYLDGVKQTNVIIADCDQGLIVRHPELPAPGKRVSFRDVPTETLHGAVTLIWKGLIYENYHR